MTREKLEDLFYKASDNSLSFHDVTEVVSLASIDIILNELFSQTCGNCKHYKNLECKELGIRCFDDFYCKAWELKD